VTPSVESDLGTESVRDVHQAWQVDDEWCEWEPRGFCWWGHRLRQRVWAEPGFEDGEFTIFRVCAMTDLVAGVREAQRAWGPLAAITRYATASAPVLDQDSGRISLFSSVYVHEQIASWIVPLFARLALLQPIEAERVAEHLATALGGEPAASGPGDRGSRSEPDEMLTVADLVYAPHGEGPSAWADDAEFDQVAETLNQGNAFATGGASGLTAEFPFGAGDTALFQADTRERHPHLGSGLLLRLTLPFAQPLPEAVAFAALLNGVEAAGDLHTPALGAWTVDSAGERARAVFVSFLPSILHSPGLLLNLTFHAAGRAAGVAALLESEPPGSIDEILDRRLRTLGRDR